MASIRELVSDDVHQIDEAKRLPFADAEFDRVVVVDMLEHVARFGAGDVPDVLGQHAQRGGPRAPERAAPWSP